MKIERFEAEPPVTLESFADKHGLIMEVHERSKKDSPSRYYAHFKSCEMKNGGMLVGNYGNGLTEAEAIKNYAKEISGRVIVIDAMRDSRREIYVPTLAGT